MKIRTLLIFFFLLLSACAPSPKSAPETYRKVEPISTQTVLPTETPTRIPSPSATYTLTASATVTPTAFATATAIATFMPTATRTATVTPTYALLRGEVIPEHLNCRYGPGVMYLYKYGLLKGNRMEVLGKAEDSTWVLVQAIGGDNACWVNSTQLQLNGELDWLEPLDAHIVMAWSPYYGALESVLAERSRNEVKVFWTQLPLRAGDDSEQIPYVLETWVCQDGEIVFQPIGSWMPWVTVIDEPGCDEPSRARILAAEKHGYTPWLEVNWPQHEDRKMDTP